MSSGQANRAITQRDEDLATLQALVPPFTAEELRQIEKDAVTFEQVLDDLKGLQVADADPQ
jgi:hypothetical protein